MPRLPVQVKNAVQCRLRVPETLTGCTFPDDSHSCFDTLRLAQVPAAFHEVFARAGWYSLVAHSFTAAAVHVF